MREIKFRAWDSEERFMYYGVLPVHGSRFLIVDQTGNRVHEACGESVHIMQFTGLLDRHGKEIWEGDRLQSVSTKLVYTVTWVDKEVGFIPVHESKRIYMRDWAESEVIDNIYETPNLSTTCPADTQSTESLDV